MKKKHWYDYLWIFSSVYLILGFFNILFAWIGLICFFAPLLIAVKLTVTDTVEGDSCFHFWEEGWGCRAGRISQAG